MYCVSMSAFLTMKFIHLKLVAVAVEIDDEILETRNQERRLVVHKPGDNAIRNENLLLCTKNLFMMRTNCLVIFG